MPARRQRRRVRGTKPRTHLSAPFHRIAQRVQKNPASRRRARSGRS